MPLIVGDDGYPVPEVKKTRERFACICPICVGATANMSVAKSGNWIIRCPACTSIIYLNDVTSINLFRGLQRFLDAEPDHQLRHATGIVGYAPDEGS
jgi:hypothetical protein